MTLGILVDDAIIVSENVYTHFSNGKNPHQQAALLTVWHGVGSQMVMAVSTTIVAFSPLLFISGIMGKFIAIMPKAVIFILVFLVEALYYLPSHLYHALTPI